MRGPRRIVVVLLAAGLALPVLRACRAAGPAASEPVKNVVLAIHGGEGDLDEKSLSREERAKIQETLEQALTRGRDRMTAQGGTSLDGVEEAIRVLEDSGLFDAGKGTVLDHDGHASLDASIMEGKNRKAGAVAGVTLVKNPIRAARAVMEKSRHVLLVGRGADLFALQQGLTLVPPDYFLNPKNWEELQEAWKKEAATKKDNPRFRKQARAEPPGGRRKFGTVGAVALKDGVLAAGTSTGGLTNKLPGRVGDSPIIGAGTYADNATCAVSCTGIGEYFIRYAVASDVSARVRYKGIRAREAADQVVEELKTIKTEETYDVPGVEGGLIVLDRDGTFTAHYNATQMTRGSITRDGKPHVILFDKAPPK
jgi:beta-aspartyl-peptidase (threonine type)